MLRRLLQSPLHTSVKLSRQFSTIKTKKSPASSIAFHGHTIQDPYKHLAHDEKSFMNALNEEINQGKKFYQSLDESDIYYDILEELKGRGVASHAEPPEVIGDYEYYTVLKFNKEATYYCMMRRSIATGKEEIVFDPYKDQAFPRKYLNTHSTMMNSIADSQDMMATCIDIKSDELPTGFIRDIANQRLLSERLPHAVEIHFTKDGKHVLYVQRDDKVRNARLVMHKVGDVTLEEDRVVYEELDEAVWLNLEVSKCKQFFVLFKISKAGNQLYVADRSKQQLEFIKISTLEHGIMDLKFSKKGVVFHSNNHVYFIPHKKFVQALAKHSSSSNKTANKLQTKEKKEPYGKIASEHWTKVVPMKFSTEHSLNEEYPISIMEELKPTIIYTLGENEVITETDVFDNSIILYLLKVSKATILQSLIPEDIEKKLQDQPNKNPLVFTEVSLGESNQHGVVRPGANQNSHQDKVRIHFDSPFTYNKTYDLDIASGKVKVIESFKIQGKAFNENDYETTVVFAPTIDGVKIPITLIHKKNYLNKDKLPKRIGTPNKLLLRTYGCYNMNNTMEFDTANWSLLERGWIIAYGHIRGGGDLGKAWHESAIKLNKHKTAEDIIACCNFLVAEGFTHPSLLCATSNSGGAGMLAAAMNIKPQTFKAVHLSAPFLDIRGCLLDPDQPLSQSDYHEFGNPITEARSFDAISSLCPYTNLLPQEYPSVLITAYEDDYRTPMWNILKYTNKFRSTVQQPTRVKEFCSKNIAVIIDEGSHLGTADQQSNVERTAIATAFYEWAVESMSTDVEKKVQLKLFSKLFGR
jgi:protease II